MANTFALILTLATLIAGVIWCFDRFRYTPMCKRKIEKLKNITEGSFDQEYLTQQQPFCKPSWMETGTSVFPVLAFVLVIRSFVYEPFQIPSGSMMPTLLVGDFMLVEKFAYGIKDPILQNTLLKTGKPKRGDIAVFKYPKNPTVDFVKRVVGLPGDKIVYNSIAKELTIYANCGNNRCENALPITYSEIEPSEWTLFFDTDSLVENQKGNYQIPLSESLPDNALRQYQRKEMLGDVSHEILVIKEARTESHFVQPSLPLNEWIVPKDQYFMMGDNRDNSSDSRMWGFVPEKNLVGRAVFIWLSLDKQEGEWPTGIRFSRLGPISH